jgi:hypothetical protein
MHTKLIIILIFIIPLNSIAQTRELKGNGLVSVNLGFFPTLKFYEHKTDKHPAQKLIIYDDKEIRSFTIENLDSIRRDWFSPLPIQLDYNIFYFQCLDFKDNWYQLVVNEKTNLKYWVKKSSALTYLKWEEFISNVVSVNPLNGDANPILKSPVIGAEKCKKQLINCLIPIEIIGEWMKVKVEPSICDITLEIKEEDIFEGYIRWKSKKELLIDYWLLL